MGRETDAPTLVISKQGKNGGMALNMSRKNTERKEDKEIMEGNEKELLESVEI